MTADTHTPADRSFGLLGGVAVLVGLLGVGLGLLLLPTPLLGGAWVAVTGLAILLGAVRDGVGR